MDKSKIAEFKEAMQDAYEADRKYAESPEGRRQQSLLEFATLILRHLESEGLTQKQFAQQIRMKPEQLSRIIHAEANITMATLYRVWTGLGRQDSPFSFDSMEKRGETAAVDILQLVTSHQSVTAISPGWQDTGPRNVIHA